jgi:tetratricopeptide (TPR) repeat protein
MGFMINALRLFTTAALISSMSFPALAAERVSVKEWAQNWAKTLSTPKALAYSTADLEKKTVETCSDCENKDLMKKARTDFEAGKFDQAISSYNKIPRADTYWLSAVEEKGWSYFRKGDFEKTLAQTKTLLAPQFATISNSEAFLLQSLTQLKICDYKGVFETHAAFKERQKARIMEVQALAKSGWNDSLTQVLKKADKFPLTMADMGESVQKLPLDIYKDIEFQRQVLRFKASEKAIVYVDAKNVNVQAKLEKINDAAFKALKNRVQELAQEETNENFKIIQKLNLVEVEAIQRVHTDQALTDDMYAKKTFQKVDDDKLVFMDDGRPWIDELDKFEVATKSCAQGLRRKM